MTSSHRLQVIVILPIIDLGNLGMFKVALLYSTHQPLVHVVIHIIGVKVWVVQHLLYEILNKSSIELLLSGDTLASREKTWSFPVQFGKKAELPAYNMLFNIRHNMLYISKTHPRSFLVRYYTLCAWFWQGKVFQCGIQLLSIEARKALQ